MQNRDYKKPKGYNNMNKILISTIVLAIISGCSSTTEVKPQIVEKPQPTPQVVQPVATPKVEVKKEDPFEVAKQSCLTENAQGCIDFGWIMIKQEDYKTAKTAFSMAYDYGDKYGGNRGLAFIGCIIDKDAKGCRQLAYLLEDGKGGNQDYKLAREFYQKAIDLGDTDSLGALAHLYSKGLGGEKSQFKATKLFEKSCNVSSEELKYEDCYNAGGRYDRGEGVRQDNFKAVKLYRKACNGGEASGCNNLGYMYYYGKGVRQSKSMAQMYYGKGCDLGSDMACENYAKNNR